MPEGQFKKCPLTPHPQRLQLCQPVSLVSLDWTGKGGVIGDHCGLSQSTYEEVSANRPVSDFRKVAFITFTFFFDKGKHAKLFLVTLLPFVYQSLLI